MVFRFNSGNLFGEFALWGRKTHFRQIEFAGNGVGKPIFGQSIPIRGQAQGLSYMGGGYIGVSKLIAGLLHYCGYQSEGGDPERRHETSWARDGGGSGTGRRFLFFVGF